MAARILLRDIPYFFAKPERVSPLRILCVSPELGTDGVDGEAGDGLVGVEGAEYELDTWDFNAAT